ncbi:MAG: crosslink repair DNA glycosylase YcaQ family protein, partial [Chloroflexia bacterium]
MRLEDFKPECVADLLNERRVVRIALMRSTIHLVTVRDCLALPPVVQEVVERSMSGNFGKRLAGLDRAALAQGIRAWVPLVHAPPRSIWGVSGAVTLTIKPFTYLSEDDTAAL